METDPVSEMLCSLEYRTMNKVQKTGNPMFNKFVSNFANLGCFSKKYYELSFGLYNFWLWPSVYKIRIL
jgi:hypothetical protein